MIIRYLTIVFLLCLSGCSGGISGTGDGGPVVDTGNTTSDAAPDGMSPEGMNLRLPILPDQLVLTLPPTLQPAPDSDRAGDTSPGQQLRREISSALQDTTAIQADLILLQNHLTLRQNNNTLSDITCANTCSLINAQLSVDVNADTEVQLSALADGNSNAESDVLTDLRAADRVSYSDVSLQSGLTGMFDSQLQYRRNDGSVILLRWSADQLLVSVLAQNTGSTLYSLLQADINEMTLRRTNHIAGDQSIQFTAVQRTELLGADATYIEADFNTDQPRYFRAVGDQTRSAIFTDSLSTDMTRYRESNDASGQLTDLETCVLPCGQWQSLASSSTLDENYFDNRAELIDTLSNALANPLDVSGLPDQTTDFIITVDNTQPDSQLPVINDAASPSSRSTAFACAGQRLDTRVRVFCWLPTPLNSRTYLFDELRINNTLTYTLIRSDEP